jgi:hypothetical protein
LKVELLYFEGCPGFQPTLSLLKQVLDEEEIPARVQIILVDSEESANKYRFQGSPSIRVDGEDIEPEARSSTDFGMKCRIYDNEGVPGGVPAKRKILEAIRNSIKKQAQVRD